MEETQNQGTITAGSHTLMHKISFFILLVGLCVLPFFFVPSPAVPLAISKMLLVSVATFLALGVYCLSIIQSGKVLIPKNLLTASLLLVVLSFVVSAVVNGGGVMMYFGYGFEVGTVSYILVALGLFVLGSQLVRTKERQAALLSGFLLSALVVGLFQIVQVITGGAFSSFTFLSGPTGNLIGSFNDLGLFFGFALIVSLLTLELGTLRSGMRGISHVVYFLSLILLAIVNFSTLWIVLAIFALLYSLYVYSFDTRERVDGKPAWYSRISTRSIFVAVVSIVFLVFGQSFGDSIAGKLGTSAIEVRPSWGTTIDVAQDIVKENIFFGSGPSTFGTNWLQYKPVGVNETVFWNTDFSFGIGLIPTYIATTGLLGLVAWVTFFALLLLYGLRALYFSSYDRTERYLLIVTFFVSLFLWVMSIVYVPGITTSLLAFLFTGLFLGNLYNASLLKESEISFEHYPKLSFLMILCIISLIIGVITLGYGIIQKNISQIYFASSVLEYQKDSNLELAEAKIAKAIKMQNYDTYHRGLTELNLIKVDSLLADTKVTQKDARDGFQKYIASSIEHAREATKIHGDSYLNWLVLAQVYGALAAKPFEIPGAYESAKESYEKALLANPHSPLIKLSIARLEVVKGNLSSGREFANQAIAEKQNYADAHFLLAQIEATQGNVSKAIPALETTIVLTPNSPGLNFQLGLLKYNNKDYVGSAAAFESAVTLVPEYANAKYFLGLSYAELNRVPEAIVQFQDLVNSNPENQEVKIILDNLTAGRPAFDNTVATIDSKPESRKELPLKESN